MSRQWDIVLQPPFYVRICSLTSGKANVILKKCKNNTKNKDTWEYAGPVFPLSCSDHTYGRYAVHELPFVEPKFRLLRVQKKGKKRQKIKNCVLRKRVFHFSVFKIWT